MIDLYNADCLEVMKKLINDGIRVDAIITDPPYKTISGGNVKGLSHKWTGSVLKNNDGKIFENNNVNSLDYLQLFYDILKDDSHLYLMTNLLNLFELKENAEKVGFKLHNLLVWEKNNATPNRWYMKNAEYVLFMRKGKAKPINNLGSKTVHQFPNIIGNKLHPTQKPTELIMYYVLNSTKDNDIVLDPFMGSGTTGFVCNIVNRNFIGIELDKNYFDIAENRIKGNRNETHIN